jgi:hypothetical protein
LRWKPTLRRCLPVRPGFIRACFKNRFGLKTGTYA